jgi:hypothetical protein
MTYIQIPEEHDALGFLALATSGPQWSVFHKTPTASSMSIYECSDKSVFHSRNSNLALFVYQDPHELEFFKPSSDG